MELIIFIIAFIALRYFVTNKRPELKGKINGVILIPIMSLAGCYLIYEVSDNFMNNVLRNIDSLRYVSTYTPFLGSDLANMVSVAQEYGYAPYEFVSQAPEIADSFMLAASSGSLSFIGIITSLIWLFFSIKFLMDNNPRKKGIKILSITSYIIIALAFILVLSAFSKLLGYLNIENYTWSTSFLYLPILLVMVYAFNRSYGDLCEHFENEQKTE